MKKADTISVHDQEASQYDKQVHEYNSYLHDALFGMCYEYVNSHERLLDIGIGTGLASKSFAKAGLAVYGCDGSSEMLKVCDSKAFTKELKILDLRTMPLPYSDSFFNHVICCGVFHFFSDLDSIIKEVFRISKSEGIFAFTVAAQDLHEEAETAINLNGYIKSPTPWGVSIFKHNSKYITDILQVNNFEILKTQKLLIRGGPKKDSEDMLFRAYIARVTSSVQT